MDGSDGTRPGERAADTAMIDAARDAAGIVPAQHECSMF